MIAERLISFALIFFVPNLATNLDSSRCCNRLEKANKERFPTQKITDDSVRIIAYNVRGESSLDRKMNNGWDRRKGKISSLILSYQPDIIVLEGVKRNYIDDVVSLFPLYACQSVEINEEEHHDVAILVLSEKIQIKEKKVYWLSGNSDYTIKPSYPAWGGKKVRAVLQLDLFHQETKKDVVVFGTHFDSQGMDSRINSAKILVRLMNTHPMSKSIILAGDFNFIMSCSPEVSKKSEEAYQLIINDGNLDDVRDGPQKHFGPDGTWIGWSYDKYSVNLGSVGERLDHIFIRNCSVIQEGVINLKVCEKQVISPGDVGYEETKYPSDHLPVIADIVLR